MGLVLGAGDRGDGMEKEDNIQTVGCKGVNK